MKTAFSLRIACLSALLILPSLVTLAADEDKADSITIVTPAKVKATILRESGGGAIVAMERSDDTPPIYNATVKIEDREYIISVEASGKLQAIELKLHTEQEEARLESFPAAVKASLLKLARGAQVEGAEAEQVRESYSIIVRQDGAKYRIAVDEKGKLVNKQLLEE